MAEQVIIRQNKHFGTEVKATDPHQPESTELRPVSYLHELSPYGMLLLSAGACTAILLNSYAQNHEIDLEAVSLQLTYERDAEQDCKDCETDQKFDELIRESMTLEGDLSSEERQRLFRVSHQCSVVKILRQGIEISSQLEEA